VQAGSAVPTYTGRFGPAQAERLLWRGGFGPRPGEAKRLAAKGLHRAVLSLTRPPAERLTGPAPVDDRSFPIAPLDASGHDHLWWLDRMVRTNQPLVERMALVWHDWFATSNQGVGSQKLMLDQNATFRKHALGSFRELLLDVTADPAMLQWLNGNKNAKGRPNENYARELMELFTLGADRGAYSETDVREQARALTGWRSNRVKGVGPTNFRYDPKFHDDGMKTVFGKSGAFDWHDACRLCLGNPDHASFFVAKLWGYFVPTTPPRATQRALERIYARNYEIRPVVEAILQHPALYTGPRMVKPPVVYAAGMLRSLGRGIATTQWFRVAPLSGQRLFYPPNVAGWDETRWLDTATFRGRWFLAAIAQLGTGAGGSGGAAKLVDEAVAYWRHPPLTKATRGVLLRFAKRNLAAGASAADVEVALRQLIATSPDLQTC
jgi:uncharacterized protein (DUF1800 family)